MHPKKPPVVVVTGCCGFIGYSLSVRLLNEGYSVVGIDNINDYYSVSLKKQRLRKLLDLSDSIGSLFLFSQIDIACKKDLFAYFNSLFDGTYSFGDLYIVNLAAQAGVRYSILNPEAYIHSNIVGYSNIIDAAVQFKATHFLYASSSSVYGAAETLPNRETDICDSPLSLYAATKRSNELIAYAYSNIHNLNTTGLRFFTAYGPWGRPDMALFLFAEAISSNKPIQVFNNGNMIRDFTYIDDLVESVYRLIFCHSSSSNLSDHQSHCSSEIFNIGNSQPRKLLDYISILEECLGAKALLDFKPMQLGDSPSTQSDTTKLKSKIGFVPTTPIEVGVNRFVDWYLDYKKVS